MTETCYEAIRQDGGEIVSLIQETIALSPAAREAARVAAWDAEQGPTWDAAYDAAWDAAQSAAGNTLRVVMWGTAWDDAGNDVWEAVLATAVRDVISPEHYATLMAPMEAARAVMLRERPQ